MRETVYRLSLLKDDVRLINENGLTLTVKELNKALEGDDGIDIDDNWHSDSEIRKSKWYIARKDTWSVDAERMLQSYINDSTNTDTAPGWRERAMEAIEEIDFEGIEKTIMDVLSKSVGVTEFYEKAEKVDITQ